MSNKTADPVEEAWQAHLRKHAPTPPRPRETFNDGFQAGFEAAEALRKRINANAAARNSVGDDSRGIEG